MKVTFYILATSGYTHMLDVGKNRMWITDSLATSFVLYLLFGCLAGALSTFSKIITTFETAALARFVLNSNFL